MRKTVYLALACIIFLSGCAMHSQQIDDPNKTSAPVPEQSLVETHPTPTPMPKDWFVGEWAGVTNYHNPDIELTDFETATVYMSDMGLLLLEIYETCGGYEAKLDLNTFTVSAYDEKSITLVCAGEPDVETVERARAMNHYAIDFQLGETFVLNFTPELNSANSEHAPKHNILRGQLERQDEWRWDIGLLLAKLPPSKGQEDGAYPRWHLGYEDMEGGLRGIFKLCEKKNGASLLGIVYEHTDVENPFVFGIQEDPNYTTSYTYAPRDGGSSDIAYNIPVECIERASWRCFLTFDPYKRYNITEVDNTKAHIDFYRDEYIPKLEAEIAAMAQENTNDLYEQGVLLAKKGLLHYAKELVAGRLSQSLIHLVPDMIVYDPRFVPEGNLAGIQPGDTVADAKKMYTLFECDVEMAKRIGYPDELYGTDTYAYYSDGKGILLQAYRDDGAISTVWVTKPGYGALLGRDIGDSFNMKQRYMKIVDGTLEFGSWYLDSDTGVVSIITMRVIQNRVWDEIKHDIDGDGKKERLTLSGRSHGYYVERGTVLGEPETIKSDEDYGTRARLSVYKDDVLIEATDLPMYIYYLLPAFSPKQPKAAWELNLHSETGGTGSFASYYHLKKNTENAYEITYLGTK